MNVEVKFEGVPQLVAAIKRFEKDSTKRSTLLKIYRQQAKPYLDALRGDRFVPKADRTVKYSRDKSIEFKPGNLRKSMKVAALRKKKNGEAAVWIGPQVKKAKGSGYYGYFLLPGTGGNIKSANRRDWTNNAWNSVKDQIQGGMTKELAAYLRKNAKKLGFEVT